MTKQQRYYWLLECRWAWLDRKIKYYKERLKNYSREGEYK